MHNASQFRSQPQAKERTFSGERAQERGRSGTHLCDADAAVAVLVEEPEGLSELADGLLGELDGARRHGCGCCAGGCRCVLLGVQWRKAMQKSVPGSLLRKGR